MAKCKHELQAIKMEDGSVYCFMCGKPIEKPKGRPKQLSDTVKALNEVDNEEEKD